MGKVSVDMRSDICSQAVKFLSEHGFEAPPLPPDQALQARKLEVTQLSLDDLLIKANLPPEHSKKIQAMLDTKERAVTFRNGLPVQQRNWGSLHEIGHEFLPWQSQLIYYCPLLMLPLNIQEQFEIEADVFASEAFFFGDRFVKYAAQGDWGLATAVDLADNVFETSLHATFRHYVENSEKACCLLVWQPKLKKDSLLILGADSMSLQHYIKSPTFKGHIDPGQIADSDDSVTKVFCDMPNKVVVHTMEFMTKSGDTLVAEAQSYSNSYNVFTLISQPQPLKCNVF
ncbi:MAG: hypothetical protein WB588_08425 [Dehalococcoidia bacterium]